MKPIRKKSVLFLTAAALTFSQPSSAVTAEESDPFYYEITDGNAVVTRYLSYGESDVEIPESIDGYTVVSIAPYAFSDHIEIASVSLPETVEVIQKGAFNACTRLESVDLGESPSLRAIEDNAFYGCSERASFEFPEGLERIGKCAFFLCGSLREADLPSTLISLGLGTFATTSESYPAGEFSFSSLERITFAQGCAITEIPDQMCQFCSKLKRVDLPDTVTSIGARAFQYCQSLSEFSYPESLETVGELAFYQCSSLPSLISNVREIGDYAFCHAFELAEIELPNLSTLGSHVFDGVGRPSAKEDPIALNLPAGLSSVKEAFLSNNEFSAIRLAEGCTQFRCDEDFAVYGTEEGSPILLAVAGCSGRTSYTVREGTEVIGEGAFTARRSSLQEIILPEGLREIRTAGLSSAYDEDHTGTELIIPDSVTALGEQALSENFALSSVVIGSGVTVLPKHLLANDGFLQSAELRGAITEIDAYAFPQNSEAFEIQVPGTIRTLHPTAFGRDWSKVTFTEGVVLENGLLLSEDRKTLIAADPVASSDTVVIPEGVEVIRDNTLSFLRGENYNHPLTFVLPDSVTEIGTGAFGTYWVPGQDPIAESGVMLITETENPAVIAWAEENDVGCFRAKPKTNAEEITISSGETFVFAVSDALRPLVFTSSDSHIAKADRSSGEITGVSKGDTTVIAACGTDYFLLEVHVIDGEYDPSPSEENTYFRFTHDNLEDWEKEFKETNPIALSKRDNPSIITYSGSGFQPMKGLEYLDRAGDETRLELTVYPSLTYGRYVEPYRLLNRNLTGELERGRMKENLLLYSGTTRISNYTMNPDSSVQAMTDMIGTVFECPPMISGTLSHSVANGYSKNSPESVIFEIYLPKKIHAGTYIQYVSLYPGEQELLLESGLRFYVADAGVRKTDLESLHDGSVREGVIERFMKVLILGPNEAPPEDFDPYITTSREEPTPTPTPTPAPTPKPKPSPSEEDGEEEETAQPQAAPAVVTCQDAGYPQGWYWDEAKKACVPPAYNTQPAAPRGTDSTTAYSGNTGNSGTPGTSGTSESSETAEESASPAPTPSPTPVITLEPAPPETDPRKAEKAPFPWFLLIPGFMIIAGGIILLAPGAPAAAVIAADAVLSAAAAYSGKNAVGWIMLVLNLAALGLLALYRRTEKRREEG